MEVQVPGHTAGKRGVGVDSQISFLLHPQAGLYFLPLQISLPRPHPPCAGASAPCGRQVIDFTREGAMGEALSWKEVEKWMARGISGRRGLRAS